MVSSADERARVCSGDDRGMATGTGDRDVEEAAFFLDVVGQSVRVLLDVGQVHDHVRPLLPLTRCTVESNTPPGARLTAS